MSDEKSQKALPIMKLLVFIIDWNKVKIVSTVFENEHVRFHFISKARGTASSEILDVLGIGSSEKAVVLCLEQDVLVPVLFKEVRKQLSFHRAGAGIAFTIPLSGINNPILQVFKESIHKNDKIRLEKEVDKMGTEIKHDLIVSIINQGYSDEFMAVAREAGASGGTVLNARGLAHQGPVKFFGVSVQDEKEIIIIVTNRDKKTPIMQAVSQTYGITSEAGGIIFSLPVDTLMGLNLDLG
jgi:nitrogen regulatory protein PII